jgi:hypothetical protein
MAKDFPEIAYHSGGDTAYPVSPTIKIVPSVPASQSERPQLRPVGKDQ